MTFNPLYVVRAGQTHHVYVFLSSSWNPDLVGKRKTVLEISDRFWEDIGPSWTRLT